MKSIIKIFFTLFSLVLVYSVFFVGARYNQVFASTYGECAYGASKYNNNDCSTSSSSSNSSGSSNNNSSGSSTCGNTPPSSAPDLFQINTNNTTATLFLAPAGKPYNNYSFSFGTKPAADMYGGGFNQENSSGVISFTINLLKPNTTYYFKINAGNGCAGGPSSSVVLAKTTGSSKSTAKYYKSKITAITSFVGSVFKQDKTASATKVQNTGSSIPVNQVQNGKIGQSSKTIGQQNTIKSPAKKGFFDSVVSFIKGLF